jgi:hypothetical protein
MTYFIPKLDINIYVDASPVGLGGNTVTRKQEVNWERLLLNKGAR